jgi:hypothetical protein
MPPEAVLICRAQASDGHSLDVLQMISSLIRPPNVGSPGPTAARE